MKTLNKITSVSFVSETQSGGEQLHRIIVPKDAKVVELHEIVGDCGKVETDTVLSAIERSLVTDFTAYYDKLDKLHECEYNEIKKCNVSFSDGSSIIYSGSDVQETGVGDMYCIRQVSQAYLRSFELVDQTAKNAECIGVDMTKSNISVSTPAWLYIEETVNRVLGCEYVKVDPITFNVSFNLLPSEEDKYIAEGIYLLISEIVCLGEERRTPLYVLVSRLPHASAISERLVEALDTLKYDCQVFIP